MQMGLFGKNVALATLLFCSSWAAVFAEGPCETQAPAPAPAPTPGITTTGGLTVGQQVGIGVGTAAGAAVIATGIAVGATHCEWGDCGTTTTPIVKTLTLTVTPPKVDCDVTPKPPGCRVVGETPAPTAEPVDNTTYFSGSPSLTQPVLVGLGVALLACCLLLCCLALLLFFLCGGKKESRKVKPYKPLPVVAPVPEPVAAEPEVFVPPLLPFLAPPVMMTTVTPVATQVMTAPPVMIAPPVTTAHETVIAPPVMGPTFTTYEASPAYVAPITTVQEAAAPAVITGMTTAYETAPAVIAPMTTQTMMASPVTTAYQTTAAPAMMMGTLGYATGVPMATAGVDVNRDGRANYMYSGMDLNRDGIPDALQRGF